MSKTKKLTYALENFISKANIKYDNKYDYSEVTYINAGTQVDIKCTEHGIFKRTPQSHLNGSECYKCCPKKSSKQLTQEEFIERCNIIHKSKYNYSLIIYVNTRSWIKIICPIHKKFKQMASAHLYGRGCAKCSKGYKYSCEEWIEIASEKYNNFYDYSLVNYENKESKVTIICPEHGKFEQRAGTHLNEGGCIKCGRKKQASKVMNSLEDFIFRSQKQHGNKYDYSETEYDPEEVSIHCPFRGIFKQDPHSHMKGKGCKKCAIEARKKTEEQRIIYEKKFIEKAIKIHGDKYDYSEIHYEDRDTMLTIKCKKHDVFEIHPRSHLELEAGCPTCSPHGYSKIAIGWLNRVCEEEHIKIKHSQNGGEFKIPNSNYRADGYCVKTNTVYEFHGCYFHGCQDCFDPGKVNVLCHKTFEELYKNTKKREKFIKKQGFNLVTMWEHDWRKQIKDKTVINI